MKDRTVKIILVQEKKEDRDNGAVTLGYRIAKLIGGVVVSTWTPGSRNTGLNEKDFHVGDRIDEQQARDLASARAYEVTVTEEKSAS